MNSQILSSPLLLSLFILVFLVLLASGFFVKKGWWIPLLGILAVAGYLILLWIFQVSAVEILVSFLILSVGSLSGFLAREKAHEL